MLTGAQSTKSCQIRQFIYVTASDPGSGGHLLCVQFVRSLQSNWLPAVIIQSTAATSSSNVHHKKHLTWTQRIFNCNAPVGVRKHLTVWLCVCQGQCCSRESSTVKDTVMDRLHVLWKMLRWMKCWHRLGQYVAKRRLSWAVRYQEEVIVGSAIPRGGYRG